MKRSALIALGLALAPAVLAEAPASADLSGYSREIVVNNSKVTVIKATWLPGATNPMIRISIPRVVYFATKTKFKRTFADGSTRMLSFAAGQTIYEDDQEASAESSLTNVGTGTVQLVTVLLK